MKQFYSVGALLLGLGCGQSFFVRVDISLDPEAIETLALDPRQLRELVVQAIPDSSSGVEPVSFTISNGDGSPFALEDGSSYSLELPSSFENVAVTLVHQGFSSDVTINTPILFGSVELRTKRNRISNVLLGAQDLRCNGSLEPDDFCPLRVTNALGAAPAQLFDTKTTNNASNPLIASLNSPPTLRSFSLNTAGGIQEESSTPLTGLSSVDDLLLYESDGANFSIAALENDQIFIFSNGVAGAPLAANGAHTLVSSSLDNASGQDLAGITANSVVSFLLDSQGSLLSTSEFGILAQDGEPTLLGVRRPSNGEQLGVVTKSPAKLLFFESNINDALAATTAPLVLPKDCSPVSVAFSDFDGDDLDDVLILDNGVSKRLLIFFLIGNGDTKSKVPLEIPLRGELREVRVGFFDHNSSLDIAVSGLSPQGFVQFILSDAGSFLVTSPRSVAGSPGALFSLRIPAASTADSLLTGFSDASALNVFLPEQ